MSWAPSLPEQRPSFEPNRNSFPALQELIVYREAMAEGVKVLPIARSLCPMAHRASPQTHRLKWLVLETCFLFEGPEVKAEREDSFLLIGGSERQDGQR